MDSIESAAEVAELDNGSFDDTYDVVVVGYGFAGAVTAIEAADHGAKVLLVEKMPDPGGLSICSGGAVRCADDADDAFAYLKATNAGTTPDDVLRVLAEGMVEAESYVERLIEEVEGASLKATEFAGKRGGNYPFPGWETFYHTQIEVPPGFDRLEHFPNVRTRPSSGGPGMFWVLNANIERRNIDVRVNSPVTRLIRAADNELRGVVIETPDGVVFAHNRQWPIGMFSLISGFLERGETPEECAGRETREELGLDPGDPVLIGVYPFHPKNQFILTYQFQADGAVILNGELDDFKVIAKEKLRKWSFAAGRALTEWLAIESN